MGRWTLFGVSAILALWTGLVCGDPAVSLSVDRKEITVGDRVRLAVVIDFDPKADSPDLPRTVGLPGLDVLEMKPGKPEPLGQGRARLRVEYTLTSFELGTHEIPIGSFLPEKGGHPANPSDKIVIAVNSVNPNPTDKDDIRDIRGQRDIPLRWRMYTVPALLLVAALILLLLLRRFFRFKKPEPVRSFPAAVPKKAHEIALERLEEIRRKNLVEGGRVKEYYSEISDCLREYLRNRYGVSAQERTTAETRAELTSLLREANVVEEFGHLLTESDFVKFAKYRPDEKSAERVLDRSGEVVLSTAERETGPEPSPPSAREPAPGEPRET